ncbi:nitroreductase family protein [Rhodothermus marinus]|uniref:nitroreductase family protein n=1 Tax=Rhodothermus marinus TaxID=29549 RepID=UPI001FB55CBA|nr:nitroreductase family protein [Rhodothermus marinus]
MKATIRSDPKSSEGMTTAWKEDPWQVAEHDFPRYATPEAQLRFLLNYAVLAPSVHNTQPWRFRVVGSEVELYADRTRALAVADPEDRQLIMSCGAALFHLQVAMRHFGYQLRCGCCRTRTIPTCWPSSDWDRPSPAPCWTIGCFRPSKSAIRTACPSKIAPSPRPN